MEPAILERPITPEVENNHLKFLRLKVNDSLPETKVKEAREILNVLNFVTLWSFSKDGKSSLPQDIKEGEETTTLLSDINNEINVINTLLISSTNASDCLAKGLDGENFDRYTSYSEQVKKIMQGECIDANNPKSYLDPRLIELFEVIKQKAETGEKEKDILTVNGKNISVLPIDIGIKNKKELKKFWKKFANAAHDTKTPMAVIKGYVQFMQRDFTKHKNKWPKILNEYDKLPEATESEIKRLIEEMTYEEVEDNYTTEFDTKETFDDEIAGYLLTRGFKKENIHLIFAKDLPEDVNISFSIRQSLLRDALKAVAINTADAYDRKGIEDGRNFILTFRISNDGKFVELVCANDQTQYPQEIEEYGFIEARKRGIHDHGSSDIVSAGFKMAHATQTFKEIGGDIIPRNVRDENGKITGVETILRIPLRSSTNFSFY